MEGVTPLPPFEPRMLQQSSPRLQCSLDFVAQAKCQIGTRVWSPEWTSFCFSQKGKVAALLGKEDATWPSSSQKEDFWAWGLSCKALRKPCQTFQGGAWQLQEPRTYCCSVLKPTSQPPLNWAAHHLGPNRSSGHTCPMCT